MHTTDSLLLIYGLISKQIYKDIHRLKVLYKVNEI